jgi:hypothetical protein
MIEDISNEILSRFALYLRIEPRCRRDDFQQGIEARTADPLWYLTRQWQMGEFQGEDNGSPIRIEVEYHNQLINEIRLGEDPAIELPTSPPLETIIEQEAVVINWRLRIRIGQQFERFARQILQEQANAVIVTYRKSDFYPVEALAPDSPDYIYTDKATRRYLNLMAGRAINGETLLMDIIAGNPKPLPNGLNIDNALFEQTCERLHEWYNTLYIHPTGKNKAWSPHLMNYQFGLTATDSDTAQTSTISIPDYRNGELDWYSCKLGSSSEVPDDLLVQTKMFNPTRVEFAGKPNERWWAFEDNAVDFAKRDVSTTDLVRTMLMEYAFVYADDWFLIPLAVPIGSLTRIRRLRVNNVFGDDDIIRYATESSSDPLAVWDMYKLSGDSLPVIDTDPLQFASQLLMVPPAINHREESAPIEEVRFIRDEGANLVFAIEHTVSNQIGTPVEGYELQLEKYAREREYLIDVYEGLIIDLQAELGDTPAPTPQRREEIETLIEQYQKNIEFLQNPNQPTDARGLPQYRLANTVPDNWIPYVPVNASESPIPLASEMSIRLRQAQMLRNVDRMPIIIGDPAIDLAAEDLLEVKSIEPLSRLLKGISDEEKLEWLNEETVLRSGLKIQITKQRVRWFDGKTYVWLGRKVLTGRGEGSSGLEFDTFKETS